MKRIKPKSSGKTIRLSNDSTSTLAALREAMSRATLVSSRDGSVIFGPDDAVRDSAVIARALRMALLMMTPRFALLDRDEFATLVDRELLQGMANFAGRPERERLAMLDLILARSSHFSAFHASSPLMAAKPEGKRPS